MTRARGIYSIGAAARMLGVSQPAIRSWEDRYGLVVAERSEGGRRLYTRDHLEQLRFVKERLDEGLSAADAHRLLAERQVGGQPIVGGGTLTPPARTLVLLAESDRHGAELSDSFLHSAGYDVAIALTAQDAEEKFASQDPALSIVELMISGGVGRALCERLKELRGTPVLCISSLDLGEQALSAGADAFLKKPLEPQQLVATVNDLLGRSGLVPPKSSWQSMSERFSSGDRHLNAVLGGGLPANALNMIIGLPGSGKTILAEQFLFHNATPQRPAIYLSTVSEPLEKILRYGQNFDFFDAQAIGTSIFFDDLGQTLNNGGLDAVLAHIRGLITERRPGVIVIDSFKALSAYAGTKQAFRHFLHELAGILTALATTAFWVGEYAREEIATAPEFAVADGIIALTTRREAERAVRHLEVLKLRGTGFMSGGHAYRIARDGLHIFPRLAESVPVEEYELQTERTSSGIPAIDHMLVDGYWPGASTMVAGPSGSGKTLMGLHFIFNGAATGQTGIIATLQENTTQLERIVNGFGWSLASESVELMYRSPVDLYLDEWFYELQEAIERTSAPRVFIDSLGDLQRAAVDEVRFREYLYSLLQRCANQQISVMMSQEMSELFGISHLSEAGISHLCDNVILLQFVPRDAQLRRAVTVLKTRASRHDPDVREFKITPEGIVLDDVGRLGGE